MNLESVREHCLSLPSTTEMIQWRADLLFKIGGKMYAVAATEPSRVVISFKATPEHFFEYQEREGVIPAPYMARNQWLALERWDVLRDDELRDLLTISYRLVLEKLPKRTQLVLQSGGKAPAKTSAKKTSPQKKSVKKTAKKPAKKTAKKTTKSKPKRTKSRRSKKSN